jgi:hypothetical protein
LACDIRCFRFVFLSLSSPDPSESESTTFFFRLPSDDVFEAAIGASFSLGFFLSDLLAFVLAVEDESSVGRFRFFFAEDAALLPEELDEMADDSSESEKGTTLAVTKRVVTARTTNEPLPVCFFDEGFFDLLPRFLSAAVEEDNELSSTLAAAFFFFEYWEDFFLCVPSESSSLDPASDESVSFFILGLATPLYKTQR